jgi:uncharacterized damage-inducible protein DinB
MVHSVVRQCVEGLSQEDSLVEPRPGGNCLNWVLGHLLWAYEGALSLLGERTVLEKGALERFARGAPPLRDASEAMELDKLLAAWDEATRRVDVGLARLTREDLDRPAPFSPGNDPHETVRSLLSTIFFHQGYHAGQTAVLRRIAGKAGAIR